MNETALDPHEIDRRVNSNVSLEMEPIRTDLGGIAAAVGLPFFGPLPTVLAA